MRKVRVKLLEPVENEFREHPVWAWTNDRVTASPQETTSGGLLSVESATYSILRRRRWENLDREWRLRDEFGLENAITSVGVTRNPDGRNVRNAVFMVLEVSTI